jgi:hypothetical protein
MTELVLWFSKSWSHEVELERTIFSRDDGKEMYAMRGKTIGAYGKVGTFQWTPGVKALSVVFLTALSRYLAQIDTYLPLLEGGKGSLASSLDYALSKQPDWLFDMFGQDTDGNAYLRRLIYRSNSGMRRNGPIGISLMEDFLSPKYIKIFLNGKEIKDAEQLRGLALVIIAKDDITSGDKLILSTDDDYWIDYPSLYTMTPSPVIADSDNVYVFEQLQYPERSSTKDRLIEWRNFDNIDNPAVIAGRVIQAKHLFEELTYAACDAQTKAQFEKWIAGMEPKRDGEYGLDREVNGEIIPGFLTWIQEHHKDNRFKSSELYQTFIYKDRSTGEIVGTVTVAPDDRGVGERYEIGGSGHIGGMNIRWDLRNRGIGYYIKARVDQHVTNFARRHGQQVLHAFSHNRGAKSLNVPGFNRHRIKFVETDFGPLPFWSKVYRG